MKDVDQKNYGSKIHDSKLYSIYRVSVTIGGKVNFITFFSDDKGLSYGLAFEKNVLTKNLFEHYDEYGNLYADFKVKKISENNYTFTINNIFTPSTTGRNTSDKVGCVEKIYRQLKNACIADAMCDMMCDLNPTCSQMLFGWAVTYCITH